MEVKFSEPVFFELLEKYCSLLQCEIFLLRDDGIIFLDKDRKRRGASLFYAPLSQCIDQVIRLDVRTESRAAPYFYCLPVLVQGNPVFYLAMDAFDPSRLARDCRLVAFSFAELLIHTGSDHDVTQIPLQTDLQAALIETLLSDHPQCAKSQVLAESLGLDKSLLRAVICVKLEFRPTSYFVPTNDEMEYVPMLEKLQSEVLRFVRSHRLMNHQDGCTIYHQNQLIIYKSFTPTGKVTKVYRVLEKICNCLKADLSNFFLLEMKMAHGNMVHSLYDLRESYRQALEFLEIGTKQYPNLDYYNSDILMLDLICKTLHPQIIAKTVSPVLEALRSENGTINEELLTCVETLIDCCFSYTAASQRLSLHRNTLHLRIERLCRRTGLSPLLNFHDALVLKLAAIFLRQSSLSLEKERD